MRATAFESRALPTALASTLRARIRAAHHREPFSPLDPRTAVARVRDELTDLAVSAVVCRGDVDLRGVDVDHLWLAVDGRVVDVAFPLFAEPFVDVLRAWVAGDRSGNDLLVTAAEAGVDRRVLGRFPHGVRYLGAPVWWDR